jgi:hypothetical protein
VIRKAFCFFYEPVGVAVGGVKSEPESETAEARQSRGEPYRLQSLFHTVRGIPKPSARTRFAHPSNGVTLHRPRRMRLDVTTSPLANVCQDEQVP